MKNKEFSELNPKERWDLLNAYWTSLSKFTDYTRSQYRTWLDKKGFDTSVLSVDEFNEIVEGDEDACGITDFFNEIDEDDEDEDDSDGIDVDSIETREEAAEWLDSMLEKYGNTCFFPDDIEGDLDSLIERFGNTYFWYK